MGIERRIVGWRKLGGGCRPDRIPGLGLPFLSLSSGIWEVNGKWACCFRTEDRPGAGEIISTDVGT